MKTTIHTYAFNLNKVEDREPYYQLKTKLEKTPGRGHQMHSLATGRHTIKPGEIELDEKHFFENQWNSDKGRVFDWFEEAVFTNGIEQKLIKRGHYLEITDAMRALRRNTVACGYTGERYQAAQGYVFNESETALRSSYLKESELYLLRLLPVDQEHKKSRPQLTESEREYLLPKYIAAQTKVTEARRTKQLAEIKERCANTVAAATAERDGFLWLLSHGVSIENCIYYSHTGRFCFGWRTPYGEKAKSALLEVLCEFPFDYDVK